ncbi:hypothetical protein FsymDg_1996 [Candidatus Protofrankia datiscae]|uniref:Uncharacterized protein n=1 Tax=Candidatus Protofrankia datiscae TaxID=2716812 RepID=F8AXE2_9ACTN|nr:hypothetical protein FsymDg_1996 [Candidatus Protofrankia datiscae]
MSRREQPRASDKQTTDNEQTMSVRRHTGARTG